MSFPEQHHRQDQGSVFYQQQAFLMEPNDSLSCQEQFVLPWSCTLSSQEPIKPFFTPPLSPSCSSSSGKIKFPSGLAQKIGYLQMVVQMLGSNSNSASNQEQMMKLVDQLLLAARGMFLEQQQRNSSLLTPADSDLVNPGLQQMPGSFSPPQAAAYQQQEQQQHQSFHGILPKSEQESICWMASAAGQESQENNFYGTSPTAAAAAAALDVEELDDLTDAALPRGSYELIELDAMEILAEHTHFCEICGKGFKRDANLRMHMRGHGDEYKTPAALARPKVEPLELSSSTGKAQSKGLIKRYSCPYIGCKRNKQHKKFVPLKTVLCVKNHYRRSHCPKLLSCTRCRVKRFSVLADLKTHEKHCGREKWQCSCGTTFSRKDKLLGHISLFIGHKPLMMLVNPGSSPPPPPVILPSSSSSNSSFQTQLSSPGSLFNLQQLGYSSSSVSSQLNGIGLQDQAEACWSPNKIFSGATTGDGNGSGSTMFVNINNNSGASNSSTGLGFFGLDFL